MILRFLTVVLLFEVLILFYLVGIVAPPYPLQADLQYDDRTANHDECT